MKEQLEVTYWILVIGAKLRLGWILYNLIYIHILRKQHPDETFEHVSFNKYCNLAMDDLYEQLGLKRKH